MQLNRERSGVTDAPAETLPFRSLFLSIWAQPSYLLCFENATFGRISSRFGAQNIGNQIALSGGAGTRRRSGAAGVSRGR
jgi:hypothetical protein